MRNSTKKCGFNLSDENVKCCSTHDGERVCTFREHLIKGKHGWRFSAILVALFFIIAMAIYLGLYAQTSIGTPENPNQIYLYGESRTITYRYDTYDRSSDLILDIDAKSDYSDVSATFNGNNYEFSVTKEDGAILGSNRTTIFFCNIGNDMIEDLDETIFGTTYNITDPIGLLGNTGANYTIVIIEGGMWWPNEPKLHGTQNSFVIDIYDILGNKVAHGMIDASSGILEWIDGIAKLTLTDPDTFLMSRFRELATIPAIICFVLLPVFMFLYLKWKQYSSHEIVTATVLTVMFSLSVIFDVFIDIWEYSYFGFSDTIYFRLFMVLVFMLLCWIIRVKLTAVIPMLIEIILPAIVLGITGQSSIPLYTLNIGMMITTVLAIILAGSSKKSINESYTSKIDTINSMFEPIE